MVGFPFWGFNSGFPWFLLIMPLLCFVMMFFFCRMGFRRESARAANCWHRWDHHDRLAEEVTALRKEVDALKKNVG